MNINIWFECIPFFVLDLFNLIRRVQNIPSTAPHCVLSCARWHAICICTWLKWLILYDCFSCFTIGWANANSILLCWMCFCTLHRFGGKSKETTQTETKCIPRTIESDSEWRAVPLNESVFFLHQHQPYAVLRVTIGN